MNIERMIKELGRAIGKVFFKEYERPTLPLEAEAIGSDDILKLLIEKYLKEQNYNKAENIIFDEIEKHESKEIYEIALGFYDTLSTKTDEELLKGGFSKEEISQGLYDLEIHLSKVSI